MNTDADIVRFVDAYFGCLEEKVAKGHTDIHYPFITISREVGAYGTTIANLTAEYLNEYDKLAKFPWTVFGQNVVDVVLEEHSLPERLKKYMPENKVSEINDILEEMAGLHPAQWTLVKKTAETIFHLATVGNCIFVGRAANLVTRKLKQGIHVRLIGEQEKRTLHAQEYYGVTYDDAKHLVQKEDKARRDYVKQHYDRDINDPTQYDLVINTDHVSAQEASEMIGRLAILRRGSA